ncbi:hypothetical protein FALCPG4_018283 [Fusarium falciforme]
MTDPSKADAHPQSSSTGLGDDAVDAMSVSPEEGVHPDSYPRGLKFAVPMLAAYLIFTVIGLDSTILAITIPSLTVQFGTMADIGWYLSI